MLIALLPLLLLFCLLFHYGFFGKRSRNSSCQLLSILLFSLAPPAAAQTTDTITTAPPAHKQKDMLSVGIGMQYGFIFAHSENVQNTSGARPWGVELILSWQSNDAATWDL